MKQKLHDTLFLGALLTLVGCAVGQPPSRPILACQAEALLEKKVAEPTQTAYRADAPARYIVQRGDTLWGVAGRFLHSPARWKEIWYANPQIKNPNLIYPGDVISYVTVNGQIRLQVAGSNSPARARYVGKKTADGRPIYRLSPTVQVKALSEPIPTIPKEVVYPFATKNRIYDAAIFANAPYVLNPGGEAFHRASLFYNQPSVQVPEDKTTLSLSRQQTIFAKGQSFDDEYYDVYRRGEAIYSPVQQLTDAHAVREPIGIEAVYVGQLKLIKAANVDGVATFAKMGNVNTLMPNDILIPSQGVKAGGDLFFMPQLPHSMAVATVLKPLGNTTSQDLRLPVPGQDLTGSKPWGKFTTAVDVPYNAVNYVTSAGRDSRYLPAASQFSTLLIDNGSNHGTVEGTVFKVIRAGSTQGKDRSGKLIRLPSQSIGHVMVYRTYANLSYALVLDATDVINPGDCLVSP